MTERDHYTLSDCSEKRELLASLCDSFVLRTGNMVWGRERKERSNEIKREKGWEELKN